MKRIVAVSGGFDPIHPGHVRLFRKAMELAGPGGSVLVILNNDYWLRKKKGYSFMNQDDRREILLNLYSVDDVVFTHHNNADDDMSVVPELEMYRPDIFLNGGDRTKENTPEIEYCKGAGIQMVFEGTKGDEYDIHSSDLIEKVVRESGYVERPWGIYRVLSEGNGWTVKTLHLNPGEETSTQSHEKRDEYWFLVEGNCEFEVGGGRYPMTPFTSYVVVNRTAKHQLIAGPKGAVIVEVMRGEYDEDDITRYSDKYGRA